MAGSILFPNEPHWSAGSQAFWPIVDRIRAAVPNESRRLVEPLFEPAEVFQFIELGEDVSAEAFLCFAQVARSEFERCSRSEEEAQFPIGCYQGIIDRWSELVTRLESDCRWTSE